jgi:hypothetical protein
MGDYDMPEWTPLHAFAMSNWLSAQNDDTEEYNSRKRYYESIEVGGYDGPVNSIYVQRGANAKDTWEHVATIKRVSKDFRHNDFLGRPPSEGQLAYYDALERFSKAKKEEIYFVFHDDCGDIDPFTIVDEIEGFPKMEREYGDAWNVLANYRFNVPEFRVVWDRLKVPYTEGVKRVKEMQPLPVREPKPFTIDPIFKQEIDDLLPKLVDIEDEDNAPYKLVVTQKGIRQALEMRYAVYAANKFRALIGGVKPPYVSVTESYPYLQDKGQKYTLTMEFSEYDNWNGWYDFLVKHCEIAEWKERSYDKFPIAFWDLSKDPDFEKAKQKIFPVKVGYYSAHASGW